MPFSLKTNEGDISREVSEGPPQGCPLSPILYNFHTKELHGIVEEDCELVQFADDFAVIAVGANPDEASEKANSYLSKLLLGLESLDLKINVAKCSAIAFTRKDTKGVRVKIGQEKINLNNTHRYLGYTLDRSLSHRKHIEDVRGKAAAKLGIIKMLGKRSSNANPNTLVKVGNAIIRSRLEYGAHIYGNAAKSNLQKLQTVQNSHLRIAMRLLKTTPIHVIHAETGQMPLDFRREWLTLKEILKNTFHASQLQPFIVKAIEEDSGNETFLSEMAGKYNYIVCQMHPKDPNMAFRGKRKFSDYYVARNISTKLFEDQKKKEGYSQEFWRQKFLEAKNQLYKDFNHLYTDASKVTTGTALAVVDSTDHQVITERINSNFTITNAELLAILFTIEIAKKKRYQKAVIFTDSRGALQTILHKTKTTENYLAWEIIKSLQATRDVKIILQWVPSHQGIVGNEEADQEAVQATHGPQSLSTHLPSVTQSTDTWED